jgi:peptidoglycan/LPS O-acetylase OafA/YrhL
MWAGYEFLFYILFIGWVLLCLKQTRPFKDLFLLLLIMCLCVSVCMYRCLVSTEVREGVESPGAEVTGGCELPNMGARN